MAQDPYGFADTAPADGDPARAASIALWSGIAALICGMAAPCCCYFTYLAALPLSVVALWQGVKGQQAAHEGDRTSATATIVAGSVGLFFSFIWLAAVIFYVLYIAVVMFAVMASEM